MKNSLQAATDMGKQPDPIDVSKKGQEEHLPHAESRVEVREVDLSESLVAREGDYEEAVDDGGRRLSDEEIAFLYANSTDSFDFARSIEGAIYPSKSSPTLQLKPTQGETVVLCRVAQFKLDELKAQGYKVNGYAIQKPGHTGGTWQHGLITDGGKVLWWHDDAEKGVV